MGEYARYKGHDIKIGTCEDMYYLRYDQRHKVRATCGNVNPVADAAELRFRFPWPDEDHIEPGAFEDYHRSICVPGFEAPDVEHTSVQFVAQAGYNVCLPCPESSAYTALPNHGGLQHESGLRVHRNGFSGSVHLVAQKYRPSLDRLVPILKCGGCGSMWREEDPARIEELAMRLRSEGDRRDSSFWHCIADRVLGPRPEGA